VGVNEKTEFLSKTLQAQIDSFNLKRKDNKTKALRIKLAITVLGGMTTVLLGLQGTAHQNAMQNLALIFSALVTLLSTWDTFFNHRGLWTRYTATYTELMTIKSDLEYLRQGEGSLTEARLDGLYDRYQRVLRETDEWWLHERQEERQLVPSREDQVAPPHR